MIKNLLRMKKSFPEKTELFFQLKANKKALLFIAVLAFVFMFHTTSKKTHDPTRQVISVAARPITSILFYVGIIQPLQVKTVITPADGVVDDILFHYGDSVQQGQLLFTLHSEKFQAEYKTALLQYIKAKSDANNNYSQLLEGDFLHKNLLISDDDFKTRKINYYNNQLVFIQAKDTLMTMLKQLDIKDFNLYDLTIADIEKIAKVIHMQEGSKQLQIFSPASGIALLPIKNDGTSDEKNMSKGATVKQGDVLALVGDKQGFSIRTKVSEFDIKQFKVGQPVKVTGSAFPDFILPGIIAGVDHQAQANQGGVPNFSVEIIVPKLTPAQQAAIYIGMSAKVEIDVEEPAKIVVPLAAIIEKNGIAYVKLQDPKTGGFSDVAVKTGKTTMDSVVIIANLKTGDKIAASH